MWNNTQFTSPTSLDPVSTDTTTPITTAKTQADTNSATLSTLLNALPILPIENSNTATDSANANTPEDLQQTLNNLMTGVGLIAIAHPWQHTIGQGEGHNKALSAPNAMLNLSQKLKDSPNSLTGAVDAVCVLLTANSTQSLFNKIKPFNLLFPIPELQFVERKAEQLLALENNKLVIVEQNAPTNLKPRNHFQLPKMNELGNALGSMIANVSAMDLENTAPINELDGVILAKKTMLQNKQDAYQTIKNQITGAAFYSFFATGSDLSSVANTIESSNYPGHQWTHSVAIIFIGKSGELAVIKEVFGV